MHTNIFITDSSSSGAQLILTFGTRESFAFVIHLCFAAFPTEPLQNLPKPYPNSTVFLHTMDMQQPE